MSRAAAAIALLTIIGGFDAGAAEPETPRSVDPMELRGKPAPAFKLALLDGGSVELAQHQGKDVVILDFWATWCGPCRRVMPIVEEVAEAYRDRGVVLYAVNLGEAPDKIRRYLKRAKLDIPVALDRTTRVGRRYRTYAIPQTVIVATDGTVAAVHVGASPGLKAQLMADLEKLARPQRSAQ